MSQQVDIVATCPKCGKQYQKKLFRTVWGEHESIRNAVMSDNINICTCPDCGFSFHAPMAMMYVDAPAKFAVWWEPVYDSSIEEMTAGFARMLGPGNYYENAPRITDWEEFKETINKYYSGELKGQSDEVTKRQATAMTGVMENLIKDLEKKKKKNSGCMVVFTMIVIVISGLIALH